MVCLFRSRYCTNYLQRYIYINICTYIEYVKRWGLIDFIHSKQFGAFYVYIRVWLILHTSQNTLQFSALKGQSHPIFLCLFRHVWKGPDWNRYLYWFKFFCCSFHFLQLFFVYEAFHMYKKSQRSLESPRWINKFERFVIDSFFSWRTANKWEKIRQIHKCFSINIDEL